MRVAAFMDQPCINVVSSGLEPYGADMQVWTPALMSCPISRNTSRQWGKVQVQWMNIDLAWCVGFTHLSIGALQRVGFVTLQQCSRAFQWMSMAWTVFAVATDSQVFSATRTLASLHTAVSDASSWSSIDCWPSGTLHTCQIGSGGAFQRETPGLLSHLSHLHSNAMQGNLLGSGSLPN